jgi:hypothetical protein
MYPAADARMIEPCGSCSQAGLDVAQALAKGQRCKGHAQKLIPTGEALDFEVAVVPLNALAKFVRREKIHQLGENSFSGIHGRSSFIGEGTFHFRPTDFKSINAILR